MRADPGRADVEQHEHPALGAHRAAVRRGFEQIAEALGPRFVVVAQPGDLGRVALQHGERPVLDEAGAAIGHAQEQD